MRIVFVRSAGMCYERSWPAERARTRRLVEPLVLHFRLMLIMLSNEHVLTQ